MEETDKIPAKLPNQEIDYIKIAKVILSRWYWIVGSVFVCIILSNVYLWYTPKVYATAGSMKFEEKKSAMSDLVGSISNTDRVTSRVQTEISVIQSTPLLLTAIKHLDYRVSFFIVGRVLNRTNGLYPEKPLQIQLVKFDTLNFFHDILTFKPINKSTFSITYKQAGKDVQKIFRYNVPFTMGPT